MVILIRTELGRVAAAALVCVGTASPAQAAAPRASLVVTRSEGAEDCPDTATLAARVAAIGNDEILDAAGTEPRETWINVELLRVLSGYRAVISARGKRKGTRTIDDVGQDCSSLSDAVAIALVMLLDPDVPLEPKPVPPRSEERSSVTPQARTKAAVPAPAFADRGAPDETAGLRFGAEASGGATLGVVEHALPLLEGGARLRLGELVALAAGAGYVFPDRVASRGGSVKVDLVYGYTRACVRLFTTPASRFELCAEPMLGTLRGDSTGYTSSTPQSVVWTAASASAEIYTPLSGPFWWSARVRLLVPVIRQGFSVELDEQRTRAFTMPQAGGTLSLGVAAEL